MGKPLPSLLAFDLGIDIENHQQQKQGCMEHFAQQHFRTHPNSVRTGVLVTYEIGSLSSGTNYYPHHIGKRSYPTHYYPDPYSTDETCGPTTPPTHKVVETYVI